MSWLDPTLLDPDWLTAFLLAFGRIGAFLMTMPGLSNLRVPAQVRLFLAAVLALASAPFIRALDDLPNGDVALLTALFFEILIGVFLGLIVRIYFLALSFAGNAIATMVGIGAMAGSNIDEMEPQSPLVTMITLTALTIVFAAGLHGQLISGLIGSFETLSSGAFIQSDVLLENFNMHLQTAFILALRVAMPFLAYALIVNLAIGLTNKMVPQLPVYFVSMPYVIFGGLIFLWLYASAGVSVFLDGWLGAMATIFR